MDLWLSELQSTKAYALREQFSTTVPGYIGMPWILQLCHRSFGKGHIQYISKAIRGYDTPPPPAPVLWYTLLIVKKWQRALRILALSQCAMRG